MHSWFSLKVSVCYKVIQKEKEKGKRLANVSVCTGLNRFWDSFPESWRPFINCTSHKEPLAPARCSFLFIKTVPIQTENRDAPHGPR